MPDYEVKDISLAPQGMKNIELAMTEMKALLKIKERFQKEKPLKGVTVGLALHVTKETAVLVDTAVKFGLSRVYEIQAGIHEGLSDFNVFYELDEAIEWLGQDVKRGFEMIDPSPSHDA